MEKKSVLVIGGSSGIGLELVKMLSSNNHSVFVGSRTSDSLADLANVHHIPLDVAGESIELGDLPAQLQGLAYCPGTINLRNETHHQVQHFPDLVISVVKRN